MGDFQAPNFHQPFLDVLFPLVDGPEKWLADFQWAKHQGLHVS